MMEVIEPMTYSLADPSILIGVFVAMLIVVFLWFVMNYAGGEF